VWTLGIRTLTGAKLSVDSLKHLISGPLLALAAAIAVTGLHAALAPRGLLPAAGGMLEETFRVGIETCHLMGGATVPVSALVCGCRMADIRPHHIWNRLMAGTVLLRLVAVPALAVALLHTLPLDGLSLNALLVVAVQPSAMVSVSLAELHDRDPGFAAAVVFVTHVVCLLTLPVWLRFVLV
jgi:predicted permease